MPWFRSKLQSDEGNSIIEFIFIFCFGLVAVFALSSEVERNIRGHFAALSIANETLRTFQLQESEEQALRAAYLAAKTFRLPPTDFEVSLQASCVAQGKVEVVTRVRGIEETSRGNC